MTWRPTEEQMLCRDLQHAWSPFTAKREKKHIIRVLTCLRCHAKKEQVMDLRGYVKKTRMTYPHGYLRPGGGRLTRTDRAAIRRRNILEGTE